MIQLSKRLKTVAEKVPIGSRVADIGSDHAYLPVYLVQTGRSPYVVAGELNPGPFAAALRQVKEAGLKERISVRRGDGLAVLNRGEADVIVMAGMGGHLIREILVKGLEKLDGVSRLVLQPNVGADRVRLFGLQFGWELIDETILEEGGHIYEILSFAPGDGELPYRDQPFARETLLKMGPILVRQGGEIFRKKWERELAALSRIIASLAGSERPEAIRKRTRLLREYQRIKEVLS